MHDVDPDDVLYLAAALERDAAIWSDDRHYGEQGLVEVATTTEIFRRFG